EVTTAKKNQLGVRFRIHRGAVPPNLVTARRGIPVTNAPRTLLDLCACVREERMQQVIDDALRKGLVSLELLRRTVQTSSGCKGVTVLRRLVDQRSPGYQPSASELQAATRRLLIRAGLEFAEEFVSPTRAATSWPASTSSSWACRSSSSPTGAPTTPPGSTGSTTSTGATS